MMPHEERTNRTHDKAGLDPDLLSILCCPETRQQLRVAPEELITRLNEKIATRRLNQRDQQPVQEPMEQGLVREDNQVLYPVRNGIPILLVSRGIPLAK